MEVKNDVKNNRSLVYKKGDENHVKMKDMTKEQKSEYFKKYYKEHSEGLKRRSNNLNRKRREEYAELLKIRDLVRSMK